MSDEALQAWVDRHLEHAAMVFVLDDELGTHHGLSWASWPTPRRGSIARWQPVN